MYKNILIPTDGSELANKALEHGITLAKAIGAKQSQRRPKPRVFHATPSTLKTNTFTRQLSIQPRPKTATSLRWRHTDDVGFQRWFSAAKRLRCSLTPRFRFSSIDDLVFSTVTALCRLAVCRVQITPAKTLNAVARHLGRFSACITVCPGMDGVRYKSGTAE